jgi:hypothetical protein
MTKLLCLLFIASLSSISSIGAGRDERKELFGRVSTISTYSYEAVERFGEISQKYFVHKRVTKFDQKGQIIDESSYFANGKSQSKTVYDFNSSGVKIKARTYGHSGELITESDYSNGLVIEARHYDSSGALEWRSLYKYDNDEKITQKTSFDGEGKITDLTKNKYDELGRLIEDNDQCFSLNYTSKTLFKYNDNGFVREVLNYDSNGKLGSTTRYDYDEYDGFGNWTIRREYFSLRDGVMVEEREILYYY